MGEDHVCCAFCPTSVVLNGFPSVLFSIFSHWIETSFVQLNLGFPTAKAPPLSYLKLSFIFMESKTQKLVVCV